MDASEACVEELLKNMGFKSVVYDPDGNVPPDFLVDDRIAIEVRRLNQNYGVRSRKRGLEEDSISLWQRLEKLGHSFGSASDESWFLFCQFSRPIKPWKKIEPKLRAALKSFKTQSVRSNGRVFTDENFEVDVFRSSESLEHYFHMGGSSDLQAGGFVVAEMLTNIEHCASEKLVKISRVRSKYPEWWLVLTDHIGFGLNERDKKQLLAYATRPAGWDRVIVVSPSDSGKWFDF